MDGPYANREYNFMDTRTLMCLRASMESPIFKRIYCEYQDVWAHLHPSGAMPNGALLQIVVEANREIAKAKKKEKVPA